MEVRLILDFQTQSFSLLETFEFIKLAMIDIFAWQQQTSFDVTMLMQVHDELVFEIKTSDLPEAQKAIQEKMENALKLDVPLEVAVGVGSNWEEAH